MELDFDTTDEITDYRSVPPGTYVCEIKEIRIGSTRNGDPRWAMRLVVAEGEFAGRDAAWDALIFSTRGRSRVRAVFGALGLPNRGKVDIEPAHLEGRRALVEVRDSEFTHHTGETIRRNEVPYHGYRELGDDIVAPPGSAEDRGAGSGDVPF